MGGSGRVDETGLCDDSLLTFVDLFTSDAVEPQSWQKGSDSGCVQSFHWIYSVVSIYLNDKSLF